jgi:hypothetical protein
MSERDFIFAWLLATRAGKTGEWHHTDAHIEQAKAIYRIITGEANAALKSDGGTAN